MARPRKQRRDLPKRLYVEDGIYVYRPKQGSRQSLGKDLDEALRKYRKLNPLRGAAKTMSDIFDKYNVEIVPTKAPRTQRDNARELANLRSAFGDFLPDEIEAKDIYTYMEARGARVRANREIALLSHVFKKAIRWGAAKRNPCVKGELERNVEPPRTRRVEQWELDYFKKYASPMIQAYCDFKDLTGMRKGDILTLTEFNLRPEGIRYVQRKRKRIIDPRTGQELRPKERLILWTDELCDVVERIKALRRRRRVRVNGKRVSAPCATSSYLFATINGTCYYDTDAARADGFDAIWKRYMAKAKAAAAVEGFALEHFTEHDIRAKVGSDAVDEGREDGNKLLGNTPQMFRKAYDRSIERVVPMTRKRL